MLPPRLIRRFVLAPLVIVIAVGFIVLSPFLGLLALVSGMLARSQAGQPNLLPPRPGGAFAAISAAPTRT